eukprot:TRINITY_DN60295_c0_g1_i1.p1 TRINITY_DN60295_c0_g1~~TRINITY_DN60295_c0_g1_i1.p1  ORF type:complete len:345 (+),score=101.21 TRINITY_DN60295_c0_g1_i1:89-1123(+)
MGNAITSRRPSSSVQTQRNSPRPQLPSPQRTQPPTPRWPRPHPAALLLPQAPELPGALHPAPDAPAADREREEEAELAAAWPEGCVVAVHSLRSAISLNGRYGRVSGAQSDRLLVDLGGSGVKALLPGNLRRPVTLCHQCGCAAPPDLQPRAGDDSHDRLCCSRCQGWFVEELQEGSASAGPSGLHAVRGLRQGGGTWRGGHGWSGNVPLRFAFPMMTSGALSHEEFQRGMATLEELLQHLVTGVWSVLEDGRTEAVLPKASAAAVAALQRSEVSNDTVTDCNDCLVCMDRPAVGDKIIRMPCGHSFHVDCLLQWLAEHNTCPTCRHTLPTQAEAQAEFGAEEV